MVVEQTTVAKEDADVRNVVVIKEHAVAKWMHRVLKLCAF